MNEIIQITITKAGLVKGQQAYMARIGNNDEPDFVSSYSADPLRSEVVRQAVAQYFKDGELGKLKNVV